MEQRNNKKSRDNDKKIINFPLRGLIQGVTKIARGKFDIFLRRREAMT